MSQNNEVPSVNTAPQYNSPIDLDSALLYPDHQSISFETPQRRGRGRPRGRPRGSGRGRGRPRNLARTEPYAVPGPSQLGHQIENQLMQQRNNDSLWLMTAHFRPAPYKAGFQVH